MLYKGNIECPQYLLAFSLDPLAPCLIFEFIIDMIYDQI